MTTPPRHEGSAGASPRDLQEIETLLSITDTSPAVGSGVATPHGQASAAIKDATVEGAPLIGRRVGRYAVLSRIGEGGVGVIYSGFDEELDRRVAIKVLRRERLGADGGRSRIQREAQALARLSHPNVVQIHDVGYVDGVLFIAMEFVRGETLRGWQVRHDPASAEGRRAILDMYIQAGRGLAAAHSRGIIHRDFKPDNVLVGDDGRARVVDFGLAGVEVGVSADEGTIEAVSALAADPLTRTGAIMGTPAYMAPEQFLARPSDRRTDVFAFAVALYEALCGEPPFPGETLAERQAAVVRGARREPPSALPPWIRGVLARALSLAPEERFQSIDAMLAALADDPDARRRRRWRGALISAVLVVASLALIRGGEQVWALWLSTRAEELAQQRRALVEARIDALVAAGDEEEAARVFSSFIEDPDNRGRAALGAAWLAEARRATATGARAAGQDAFAAAYAAATTGRDQGAALAGLAATFREEYRWGALILAVDALARLDEGRGASEPADLRVDAALANRDLDGAIARIRGAGPGSERAALLPLLEALAPATSTAHRHRGVAALADVDGDGRPELILESNLQDRQIAQILRGSPGLPELATVDLGWGSFRVLDPGPGEPALLVATEVRREDGEERHAVVRRWIGDRLAEVTRWPEGQIMSTLAEDLDGDGARELLVGTGPYTRHLIGLEPRAGGAWATTSPSPDLDRRGSDIVELLAADLDGDGRREVVAALGPWLAYELHLLRYDPERALLRSAGRRRIGNISGAALIRRGLSAAPRRVEIAVSKTDKYPNPAVFPGDQPRGRPSGTYLFHLDASGALAESGFVAAPALGDAAVVTDLRPLVGDLDGDGRDELIVGRSVADQRGAQERDVTLIFVSRGDGSLVPAILGGALPVAVLDVDGDGDDELVLSLTDGRGECPVWILGVGDERPPALERDLGAASGSVPADAVTDERWRRAEALAEMGLLQRAAASFEQVAEQIEAPAIRGAALMRAGQLYEVQGSDSEAGRAFAAAAAAGIQEAGLGALRSLLRRGAPQEIARFRASSTPAPEPLRAALRRLTDDPRVEVDFAEELAAWWRIDRPLALRHDVTRGSLDVAGLGHDELLSAASEWDGGALLLDVDLDIEQVEWGAGIQIGILPAGSDIDDGDGPLALAIHSGGGGGEHYYEVRCVSYGQSISTFQHFPPATRAEHGGRFKVRALLLPELGEWSCAVDQVGGAGIHRYDRRRLDARAPPAGLRLVVAAHGDDASLAAIRLRRLGLRGAAVAAEDRGRLSDGEAGRRLVIGDPLGALGALAGAPSRGERARLIEIAALARLGRRDEAIAALYRLLAGEEEGAARRALAALLRAEPLGFGGLLREVLGLHAYRELLHEVWQQSFEMQSSDGQMLPALWAAFAELDVDAASSLDLVIFKAKIAARLGNLDAAAAAYRAALRVLDDRAAVASVSLEDDRARAHLRLDLAAIEVRRGDASAAREALEPVLAVDEPDLGLVDRLLSRDDLASLWDLAPAGPHGRP